MLKTNNRGNGILVKNPLDLGMGNCYLIPHLTVLGKGG
jgi:hypothetical protein